MEDYVVTMMFAGCLVNPDDPWKLWDNYEEPKAFWVSGTIVDWFKQINIPLRYVYLLSDVDDKSYGVLATGVEFRFDEPKYALLFKLRWC
jgi:hypothetical protein